MKRALALSALAGALVFSPVAATASVQTYEVTSAQSDPAYHGGNNDHAVWMPFFETHAGTPLNGDSNGSDFNFNPFGIFDIKDDGTATLTGEIVSQVDSEFRAIVDLKFRLRDGPGSGGPKKELRSNAYADNGGSVDPSTWRYFDLMSGTFTGVAGLDGYAFDFSQRPANSRYPLQLGAGANGKNILDGFAVWFYLTPNQQCTAQGCLALAGKWLKGDFNVNLQAVPVPAAGLLFATGLGGLAMRRRRKQAS